VGQVFVRQLFVSDFYGVTTVSGQGGKEVLQLRKMFECERRWQLDQEWGEFIVQLGHGRDEPVRVLFAIAQHLLVCDRSGKLGSELEPCRNLFMPGLQCLQRWNPVEAAVYFYGVKMFRILMKALFGFELEWIEGSSPE
jgi:hypothetical protein